MLTTIVGYIVLGRIINWVIVGISILAIIRKCTGHEDVLTRLNERYYRSPDAPVRMPEDMSGFEFLRVIALNLLLWPRKAMLQLRLLRCQLMDADVLIRAKAVAALYPNANGGGSP